MEIKHFNESNEKYNELIKLANRRSFFYPSAEIYPNTPAGLWNYGYLGVLMKNKIINQWRKHLVKKNDFIEIDGTIIMPEQVFKNSGHLIGFKDPIIICDKCKSSYRADKLLNEYGFNINEKTSLEEINNILLNNDIRCKKCNNRLTKSDYFSLMLNLVLGLNNKCSLRPETCQTIFTDFIRIYKSYRCKLPCGIAQIGKAFRNEISPRQSITRLVELNQMEIEIFFDPDKINDIDYNSKLEIPVYFEDKGLIKYNFNRFNKEVSEGKLISKYIFELYNFFLILGFKPENMRFRYVDEEKPFYSKQTFDFEINTSLGWLEIVANNYRQDYDLKSHSKSGANLKINGLIPHVYEISMGLDRTLFALLDNSFDVEKEKKQRYVLRLDSKISPITATINPLLNKPELLELSKQVYEDLKQEYDIILDKSGSIGKRYARADEIGVPFAITIDFDSLKNKDVTVRYRDTLKQDRIKISNIKQFLEKFIN